ncbi:hypothetical protein BGZ95_011995 [Linnemannia exigua]|uniref:Methyltransferase domain-containing protein n=1 Tax=Linnemannia exigua TaxID=604196 RepID=A0AAD4H621_9FUNG|nr:hypothetical protein BGZ95_011995 [Linnemannia exigua]
MGNVSSADQDKVNELLTRRAKKKFIASERKQRQQLQKLQVQQLKLSEDTVSSPVSVNSNSDSSRQATFYSSRMATSPHSPHTSSYTSHAPSSISSPTHTHYHYKSSSESSPLSPTVSATALSISASTTTTSLSTQVYDAYAPVNPLSFQGPSSPLASSPVAIPRQNHSDHHRYHQQQRQENSLGTDSNGDGGPSVSPTRHDFDHNSNYRQQQQQLTADLRLLGTSPEAKDWLKQKPRSSAHMLHQYNFHSHQYYQPPGSVKIVNNTCRNMSGVPHVPTLNRTSTSTNANTSTSTSTSTSALGNPVATTVVNGANKLSAPTPVPKPRPNSITAAAAAMAAAASQAAQREAMKCHSNPAEGDNPSEATPEHFDGHFYGHGHSNTPASPPPPLSLQGIKKEPRVGRLVMSWSKLNTPSISSLSSAVSSSSSRLSAGSTPGSPTDQQTPDSSLTIPLQSEQMERLAIETAELYEPPPELRPSSTLSSLRSLFGNHPQGLSLIQSLEEEDEEDGIDSLSDTESESSEPEELENNNGRLKTKKRPAPNFAWMDERKRLSASSIPTISHSVHDSQKGQHALWKYIGGGNAHAPLRYDIDRILDSGCGLGEWAMEMAKEYPSATVYGVDLNPDLFPGMSRPVPSNCLFVESNILSRLSFPDRYFDFVYQRFLYLGLTIDDWPVALKELRRVMKPGGWIELFEPCMRVHRAGPRTREVMRWISRLLQEERGLDFDFAGEKMKRLCESEMVGFQNVKLERLSIPVGAWGGRVGEAMAENMVLMFQNLQSALRESASYPKDQAAAKAYAVMVQSWIRECEDNRSYIDYYILVGQRAPE